VYFQRELDEFCDIWNNHHIRKTNNEESVSGRPSLIMELPKLFGSDNYLCHLDEAFIELCADSIYCQNKPECPCRNIDFFEMCIECMEENDLSPPTNAPEALDLYPSLRDNL